MEIDLTSCVVSKLKDTIVESKMHERALKDLSECFHDLAGLFVPLVLILEMVKKGQEISESVRELAEVAERRIHELAERFNGYHKSLL